MVTDHRAAAPTAAGTSRTVSLSGAVMSGFVASTAMLFAFAIAYAAGWLLAGLMPAGQPVAGTLRQWFYGLTQNALIDLARPNLYAAIAVYFAGGLIWAVLYAYLFHDRLAGPEWRRGLVFALVPWLFSLVVFLPLVGGGLFGLALGAGPLPIAGNLILHAVYGATLGAVYGPEGETVMDGERHLATEADRSANRRAQVGAAKGLLVGLSLGAAAWLALVGIPRTGSESALASNSLAILLATTFLGGALGALVGSLANLATVERRP